MFASLGRFKIIPVLKIREISPDDTLRVCEALLAGGLPVLEVNFRRRSDSLAIRAVAREFPDFLVGAGGILNGDQLLRAADCGAKFAVAPGYSADITRIANKKKIPFAPGAATPGDIENILLGGVVDFQFFPAEALGGIEYLKAILEPFEHLPIDVFPKGGIKIEQVPSYLELPQITAVSLTDILRPEYLENRQWDKITETARRAFQLALK